MGLWRRIRSRAGRGSASGAPQPSAVVDGLTVDLADLVQRRCAQWEERFRVRGIGLAVSLQPARVVGAGDELALALEALLQNALRFSDRGDHVDVVVRGDGERVALEVRDTGIGMLPEDVEKAFDRFHRGGLGRARRVGGSGLGLAIARDVAHGHGGAIRCDSVPGEGSVFCLHLPAAGPDDAGAG